MSAVALGAMSIVAGDSKIVVAGGQESMSLAPHASHLRAGVKMGDTQFVDTMLKDGLLDAFKSYDLKPVPWSQIDAVREELVA